MPPESLTDWLMRLIGGLVAVLVGWLWTRISSQDQRIGGLTDKVSNVELTQAREYVTRAEVNDGFSRIESKLDQISAKMDRKADK